MCCYWFRIVMEKYVYRVAGKSSKIFVMIITRKYFNRNDILTLETMTSTIRYVLLACMCNVYLFICKTYITFDSSSIFVDQIVKTFYCSQFRFFHFYIEKQSLGESVLFHDLISLWSEIFQVLKQWHVTIKPERRRNVEIMFTVG